MFICPKRSEGWSMKTRIHAKRYLGLHVGGGVRGRKAAFARQPVMPEQIE
jgi:hypothetical protein